MGRYIQLDDNNIVISVRCGKEIVEGEIESATGECGQIRQLDGSFVYSEPVIVETTDEKLQRLEENQLVLMDAIASLYEDLVIGVV